MSNNSIHQTAGSEAALTRQVWVAPLAMLAVKNFCYSRQQFNSPKFLGFKNISKQMMS